MSSNPSIHHYEKLVQSLGEIIYVDYAKSSFFDKVVCLVLYGPIFSYGIFMCYSSVQGNHVSGFLALGLLLSFSSGYMLVGPYQPFLDQCLFVCENGVFFFQIHPLTSCWQREICFFYNEMKSFNIYPSRSLSQRRFYRYRLENNIV